MDIVRMEWDIVGMECKTCKNPYCSRPFEERQKQEVQHHFQYGWECTDNEKYLQDDGGFVLVKKESIAKLKKYGKLLLDICTVMGNDPYMVWAGLENRVKILWDVDEEARGLKMADDIRDRLLKISAVEWAEIDKWEIKENE